MSEALLQSLSKAWTAFQAKIAFLCPRILAALILMTIGWGLAMVLRTLLRRVLRLGGFDARCDRSGLGSVLRRAEIQKEPSSLAASGMYWIALISAAMFSLSALELPLLDRLIAEFFLFLPRIGVAVVVTVLGYLLANFLAHGALLLSVNEDLPAPRLTSSLVRILVNALALAMALEQLGIARNTVTLAFAIAFGALMLALALAFGLGGRDLAHELLARKLRKASPDGPRDQNPI